MEVYIKHCSDGSYTGRKYYLSYHGLKMFEASSRQIVIDYANEKGWIILNPNEN